MSGIETALAALYLRGVPRPAEPHARSWPDVLSLLRRNAGEPNFANFLRSSGFSAEAAVLESRAIDHAERLIDSGLALTVASPFYPRRWVERLSHSAPPALYARGEVSLLEGKSFAIVGSRQPPSGSLRDALSVVFSANQAMFTPVSGGAPGIDRTVSAAGSYIEIWPCGLGIRWGAYRRKSHPSLQLSLWPPRELFSTAGAMERNSLVYALSEAAYVGHARFKQGGSWHGATDALRRRLTRVLVSDSEWREDAEPARKALVALGAQTIDPSCPDDLKSALNAQPIQPWLPTFAPDPLTSRALGAF